MIKTVGSRLTLWYLAFFSVLFLLFSLFLHGMLRRSLIHHLDEAISMEANTAAALLADEFQEMKGDAKVAAGEVLGDLRLRGSSVAFLAGSRVVGSSAPLADAEIAEIVSGAAAAGQADVVLALPGARAAVRRVTLGGQPYLVTAVEPLTEVEADLAALRRVLLLALPLLIAAAGAGGYWLTRRNLAPLAWMAEQACDITHSNLHTRLQIGAAAEELTVLADSFNELLSRLDESFDHMRRFVADASHELRTPLSIVRGEADVALSSDRTPAEYRRVLQVIQDESRRLSRLVDDLLNLARADAGRVKIHVQDFYLNDLVVECCRSAQTLAEGRGISLNCRAGDDVVFRGDEELIHRMVMNLVDNALRYTPGGGNVTVALDRVADAIEIRVADTGAGIAPDVLPHVFERFYRGDMARSRQDGGFGLGLAIVQWIAESHQGRVDVASAVGQGSTFTARLPVSVGNGE